MNRYLRTIAAAVLVAVPALAFAQTQPDPHHPETGAADATAQVQPPTASPEMMMQMMQMMQGHMGMMMQMMGMMQGMGTTPMPGQMGGTGQSPMQGCGMGQDPMQGCPNAPMQSGMSEAMAAMMAAMSKMDAPMMQALQETDPDVAFVKGMIPHHQGAIDMAKAELQYGDDAQVKAWADQIIAAQEKEIAEMEAWLKDHGQ